MEQTCLLMWLSRSTKKQDLKIINVFLLKFPKFSFNFPACEDGQTFNNVTCACGCGIDKPWCPGKQTYNWKSCQCECPCGMKKPAGGCGAKTWLGDECQCDCVPGMKFLRRNFFTSFANDP